MRELSSISRRSFLATATAGAVVRAAEMPKPRESILDEIERRACKYFWECADPTTGLVLDRAAVQGRETRKVASIAATGFGLSALCIASQRGYLKHDEARDRAERTLAFFARKAFQQRGFYFHFLHAETGLRQYTCELSSVDTAWLLCGVIHARQHFDSRGIRRLANELLARVDWRWMLNDGPTLSHGWTPEHGFLPWRWSEYAELLAMYLLAMGSVSHPIPASSWDAWARPPLVAEGGDLFIESAASLFVHQYSHAWFDFRNKQDGYADYFRNSRLATLRHRDFCLSLRGKFPWISEELWGISASDSRYGYLDWGGPRTPSNGKIDGTLVPCASGGSMVFLPDECLRVLETMLDRYGRQVWTQYGFVDAFHPESGWAGPDVLGIDLGIMLMMAENLRGEGVWRSVMTAPEVRRAMELAGFYASAAD